MPRPVVNTSSVASRVILRVAAALTPYGLEPLAREIVEASLETSDATADFADAHQWRLFVHGPLASAVESAVGVELVEHVVKHVGQRWQEEPTSHVQATPPLLPPVALLITASAEVRDAVEGPLIARGLVVVATEPAMLVAETYATRPQLIVFDDVEDGPTSVEAIAADFRSALGHPTPPILVLTHTPRGATHHAEVQKPIAPNELMTAVEQLCSPSFEAQRERALHDVLTAIAPADERPLIVDEALRRAGHDGLPVRSAVAFSRFVLGPLKGVVSAELGERSADLMIASLSALLQPSRAESGVRFTPARRPRVEPATDAPLALLVDDNESVLRALRRGLRREGFVVLMASTAAAAVDLSVERRPDVIVTDWRMPGVNGRELILLLEAKLGSDTPPILVLTVEESLEPVHGAVDVLEKPITVAVLAERMRAAVSSRARSE